MLIGIHMYFNCYGRCWTRNTESQKRKSVLEIFVENGTNIVKDIENWYNNFINLFEVID